MGAQCLPWITIPGMDRWEILIPTLFHVITLIQGIIGIFSQQPIRQVILTRSTTYLVSNNQSKSKWGTFNEISNLKSLWNPQTFSRIETIIPFTLVNLQPQASHARWCYSGKTESISSMLRKTAITTTSKKKSPSSQAIMEDTIRHNIAQMSFWHLIFLTVEFENQVKTRTLRNKQFYRRLTIVQEDAQMKL